ncbi:hypothetical protein Dimus_015963 [Dionaea muscipula]
MKDNGLNNVMELIKRQKWENLFKRREFIFVDAVKEFYAKMTVIHIKKKDVVKSSVKGVAIEFDHDKLTSILGVPGKNGICEYIKDVWEESKYTKPLEITRRFANDETLMAARRIKSGEMKPFKRRVSIIFPRVRLDADHNQHRTLAPLTQAMMLWQPGIPRSPTVPTGLSNGYDAMDVIKKWGIIRSPLIMLSPLQLVVMNLKKMPMVGQEFSCLGRWVQGISFGIFLHVLEMEVFSIAFY